ncbi:MAG: ABC transporter ATP-binding protein [Phycisphaerae bacterium]|nr:ABC transporter ATP-binding protein [Phycisphaerae bacterium]
MSRAPATPLLEVLDLAVDFDRRDSTPLRAVEGVTFRLYPGQTLAIVGESGSGKSVTGLSLLGLQSPGRIARGRALWRESSSHDAEDLLSLRGDAIRAYRGGKIAMIFQEPMTSLNPVMRVGDQIAEAVRLHTDVSARDARSRAVDALAAVAIDEPHRRAREYPHQFSGGMRQRVMIAMAIACRPRVLIADEPTTALDATTQAQVLTLIDRLRREQRVAVILITHSLGLVAGHADVAAVMHSGRILEFAPANTILARPLHPYTVALLRCIPTIRGPIRQRLTTVRDLVRSVEPLSPGLAGHRPWWPNEFHEADRTRATVLIEPEEHHWVRVWADSKAPRGDWAIPGVQTTRIP